MKLVVDTEQCTGCNVCVRVCPQKILSLSEDRRVRVDDEARCMGCFGCEDECPSHSIRLLRTPKTGAAPEPEPRPEVNPLYDVVIIGAGPAGLGAAIATARAGLDVCVFERLPNRHLSHHTDGGVMATFMGIPGVEVHFGEEATEFPQLGISLPVEGAQARFDRLGIEGPAGLRIDDQFPKGVKPGVIADKDRFVRQLADLAESEGVTLVYDAQVVDLLREDEVITGVRLRDGEEIAAKVVIGGDGLMGKMSQKAGLPNNTKEKHVAYGAILAYEYEGLEGLGLPRGLYYMEGDLDLGEGRPPMMAGAAISERSHVLVVALFEKKFYKAPEPLDVYLQRFIERDPRVRRLFGDALEGRQPVMLNGCRVRVRRTNYDIARDGFVSVGDAFVGGGELGNLPALAHGVKTGEVVAEAIEAGDVRQARLAEAAQFITKPLVQATEMNGVQKLMPMRIDEETLKAYFEVMQHANYPTMIFGSPWQQGVMFTKLLLVNLWRLLRRPKLLKLMMSKL